MNRSDDERLLAFLDGAMEADERARLLDEVERSPELSARLRTAAAGLAGVRDLADSASPVTRSPAASTSGSAEAGRHVGRRWLAATAVASAALAASVTFLLVADAGPAGAGPEPPSTAGGAAAATAAGTNVATGRPLDPDPSFVLVLQGWWPDAATIDGDEVQRRSREYWAWTDRLALDGRLVAAGDLRIEPGARVGPGGSVTRTAGPVASAPDFLIGMFAIRAGTYEEALAIARECPHLRYGGSVAVRQVGGGFVTVPGMGDWSD